MQILQMEEKPGERQKILRSFWGFDPEKYDDFPIQSWELTGEFFLPFIPFPKMWKKCPTTTFLLTEPIRKWISVRSFPAEYITDARFTDNNTVIINDFATALVEISLEDGSIVRKYEEGGTVGCFAVLGKRLIAVTDTTLHYYNLETGEPLGDEAALTEQIASDETNLQMTSTSSFPVVFTKGTRRTVFFIQMIKVCTGIPLAAV